LVTCHRRESWGAGLQSIAEAVAELSHRAVIRLVLHPNQYVRTQIRARLQGVSNIHLIEPCSHRELLELMRDADLVMSDSGGIQEETPALGIPLLVLREKTERPEGIAAGSARLVGTSTDRIVSEAQHLLDNPAALAAMSVRRFPYGDGRAAPRIATIIEDWLALSPRSSAARRTAGSW
jgi:UDP-N-acetylglucosamine 2-epimerase (non-hydrolysing)